MDVVDDHIAERDTWMHTGLEALRGDTLATGVGVLLLCRVVR